MRSLASINRAVSRRIRTRHRGDTWRARSHDERSGSRDESGAVLVLALVFLVTVSVIVGALTEWTTNDLQNSANFTATQTVNAAASNAVNLAVQNIRYHPLLYTSVNNTTTDLTLNASPPSFCWGSGPSQAFNMNVYCTTVWNPTQANTRQVTVTACPTPTPPTNPVTASWTAAQSTCPQAPLLQAIVTFDDYPQGVSAPSNVQCVVYCGSSMTINDWNWKPVVPAVTGASGLAGTFDGGQPITITGSGFTSGATVNFVNSDPLAQLQSTPTQQVQQIVPATNVVVNVGLQTITAQAPSVTTLANYYITVTTPGGGTSLVFPSRAVHLQLGAAGRDERHPHLGLHHARHRDHHQGERVHQRCDRDHDARERRHGSQSGGPAAGYGCPGRLEQHDHRHHLPVHHHRRVVLHHGDHPVGWRQPVHDVRGLHVHTGTTVELRGKDETGTQRENCDHHEGE